MTEISINGRFEINLPEERSAFFKLNRHWEYERLNSMYVAIRKGDTILDIGTEHGDMSALFAKWSGGQTYLIEPGKRYWYWIKETWKMNDLKDPISIPALASDVTRNNPDKYSGFPRWADEPTPIDSGFVHLNESEELPQIAIDDIEFDKLNVITMDTEGSELSILKGAKKTLEKHRPIVFISVHPEFMRERYGDTPDDLHILMTHHYGYEMLYLGFDHEAHFFYKPKVL